MRSTRIVLRRIYRGVVASSPTSSPPSTASIVAAVVRVARHDVDIDYVAGRWRTPCCWFGKVRTKDPLSFEREIPGSKFDATRSREGRARVTLGVIQEGFNK
jgi:hypothetical protein